MTTFALFTAEDQRERWSYMPGDFRDQFGEDISWYLADDPEDEPLGYTRRPYAGEWTIDDEYDAVPDWWPNGTGTINGNITVDWDRRTTQARTLLASDPDSLSLHDGVIRWMHDRIVQMGGRSAPEYSESGCHGRADLLAEFNGRRFSIEAKGAEGYRVEGAAQALAWADRLRGEWTPLLVVPTVDQLPTGTRANRHPQFAELVPIVTADDALEHIAGATQLHARFRQRKVGSGGRRAVAA